MGGGTIGPVGEGCGCTALGVVVVARLGVGCLSCPVLLLPNSFSCDGWARGSANKMSECVVM